MKTLRVALLQMNSGGDEQDANLRKGDEYCRKAAAAGADIALFPEMWNVGYIGAGGDHPRHASWPIATDSPFVTHFARLAAELGMAIAITFLEKGKGQPLNTVMLFDRQGREVLHYSKVHTCDFWFEANCEPGRGFKVGTLDTRHGPVEIGAMICYDREFPESARLLMLQGAELVLTPNACYLDDDRLVQFRVRAFENVMGMAMTNYAAPFNNGHSIAFDGTPHQAAELRNVKLVEAGEEEGMFFADFDLERMRHWRQHTIWGNSFRRPSQYAALADPAAVPPNSRHKDRQ